MLELGINIWIRSQKMVRIISRDLGLDILSFLSTL